VFFREYGALTGQRRDHVITARERYEGYWRQALDLGVRSGALLQTPRILVKGILGMLNYIYFGSSRTVNLLPRNLQTSSWAPRSMGSAAGALRRAEGPFRDVGRGRTGLTSRDVNQVDVGRHSPLH
jgi:hypothetical protein